MKHTIIAILLALCTAAPGTFAGPGKHARIEKGPNGGRILHEFDPHAEFLVAADRRIRITFLDEQGAVVAPAGQLVTVTTGERSAPTQLTFAADGTGLVSDRTLPDGGNWPVVVQIRASADAKPVTAKFTLNLAACPGCSNPEYVCTCEHSH